MAGIVGTVMLRYSLFGNTVYIASRMKSKGLRKSCSDYDACISFL